MAVSGSPGLTTSGSVPSRLLARPGAVSWQVARRRPLDLPSTEMVDGVLIRHHRGRQMSEGVRDTAEIQRCQAPTVEVALRMDK